ncbi:unnamed protein product [Sphagnum compactum]
MRTGILEKQPELTEHELGKILVEGLHNGSHAKDGVIREADLLRFLAPDEASDFINYLDANCEGELNEAEFYRRVIGIAQESEDLNAGIFIQSDDLKAGLLGCMAQAVKYLDEYQGQQVAFQILETFGEGLLKVFNAKVNFWAPAFALPVLELLSALASIDASVASKVLELVDWSKQSLVTFMRYREESCHFRGALIALILALIKKLNSSEQLLFLAKRASAVISEMFKSLPRDSVMTLKEVLDVFRSKVLQNPEKPRKLSMAYLNSDNLCSLSQGLLWPEEDERPGLL